MHKILVVDDDAELCELLAEYLSTEDFLIEAVHDGDSGVHRLLSGEHALAILDVMLPGANGFDVLRRVRATSRIPIIMLTARGDGVDRVVGLEIGADDYLPKPFEPRELLARIRAILRRSHLELAPAAPPVRLRVGDLELDFGARAVRCGGTAVTLTSVEFDVLTVLANAVGRVVSREEIAQRALGRAFNPLDRSVDMHVSNLRRKLGAHPDGAERIKSVRSVGYIYTSAP
jgi:two-component system, OmpR family, response regulator CpxR